ncbi:nitroreductase family protein [Frankia sp. AgPm24]|uniref:nitroreductase family protein n=1 Tax=Frankia sp. AgPm24 TaxID=631128 RepID=UPI00200C2FA9|nr:nitroreductase family protein [Frankia sp. AgPm24]MCK9923826.1 nitroreductase family protein [Frankia sp. AgPm24]
MPVVARYGDPAATLDLLNDVLRVQLAHRSVRSFGPRDVSEDELAALVTAAQSASTSSNLQVWSVIAVRDPERKARLATLAGNQQFIARAPLFLVWIADLSRVHRLAERAGTQVASVDYLETTIVGFVDTALAAQNAVIAAESLGLGTVFVGAVRNRPEEIAYDQRLSAYNTRFGLDGAWSDRVLARLAGPESMAGRHRLREILTRLGLPSR